MDDTQTGVALAATPTSHDDMPQRAGGLTLLGEMDGSGYKEAPCLVRRADGQTIQLTDLLYRVLESVDGERDLHGVAADLSTRIGKEASADDVRFLVDEKLRPLGLLKRRDGSEPSVEKANPLLALRFKFVISDERTTRRITAPFSRLFSPPVVVAVTAAFAVLVGWLLFSEGIGGGTRQVLYTPGLLVLTFVLAAASAGFHEFGHAAACRYSGGRPGAMGAGIYLVWPAFYTDVTDSYRLSRAGRLRTDLGGLYFNMVFACAVFGVWALTGFDALLVVIPLLLLQMVQQLLPFVRLDGYHILADLTGVPDLFARIKPTLKSLKPGAPPDSRVTALKPWVRVVIAAWVLAVIPLLALSLIFAVITLPRLAATAWDSLGLQAGSVGEAFGQGNVLGVLAGILSILALCLPCLSTVYLLSRLVHRAGRAAWTGTEGRPLGRQALAFTGLALAALLALVWWPNGEYRPLEPGERGRIQDTVRAAAELPKGRPGLPPELTAAPPAAPSDSEDAAEPATTTDSSGAPVPPTAPTTATSQTPPTTTAPPAGTDTTRPVPAGGAGSSSTSSTTTSSSTTTTTTTTTTTESTSP
jgi:putative peptide zinc metalloprotease protein